MRKVLVFVVLLLKHLLFNEVFDVKSPYKLLELLSDVRFLAVIVFFTESTVNNRVLRTSMSVDSVLRVKYLSKGSFFADWDLLFVI